MGKKVKFVEISEQVQKLLDADMDDVSARLCAREAFKQIQLSIDHCLLKIPYDGLKMKEIPYDGVKMKEVQRTWL